MLRNYVEKIIEMPRGDQRHLVLLKESIEHSFCARIIHFLINFFNSVVFASESVIMKKTPDLQD